MSARLDYAQSLRWLYDLVPRGMRLGLERMRRALELRGNPDHAYRVVQVAGTNGKGSTSAMIERTLRAQGLTTGLYTSPHLHSFTERIRVDGKPLSRSEVVRRVHEQRAFLQEASTPWLTFFEVSLIMACETFRDAEVDVAILEVGLGGRLDATTAAHSDLAVITEVGLDHTHRLGSTVRAIAREKAGIVRPQTPVVISAGVPEAREVIGRRARRMASPRYYRGRDFGWTQEPGGTSLRVGKSVFDQVDLGLQGEHQRANAAAAAMAARLICPEVDEAALRKGLLDVTWPGRLERIEGSPSYLLDAAHNPDGCVRLARYLAESPVAGPRVLLFGAMEDKDHLAMLSALDGEVDAKVYYAPPMDRACSPERLAQIKQGKCAGSLEDAVKEAKALAGSAGEIIVAGSIFVLSEVRALVLGLETDPPLGL